MIEPGTYRYTAPDGTVTVRTLDMGKWDELHDRLEAAGFCRADPVQWSRILRDDAKRRATP